MARRQHIAAETTPEITPRNVDNVDIARSPAGRVPYDGVDTADSITVLRTVGEHLAAKIITATADGVEVANFDAGAKFTLESVPVDGIHSLASVLTGLTTDPKRLVIRGRLGPNRRPAKNDGTVFRRKVDPQSWRGYFEAVPRRWVCIDIDEPHMMPDMSQVNDPEAVVRFALALLGAPWCDTTVYWQSSSKAGLPGVRKIKLHLWFWFDQPVDDRQLRAKFRLLNKRDGLKVVDDALADSIQIHYTAAPQFVGMDDPLPRRSGLLSGALDSVPVGLLHLTAIPTVQPRVVPSIAVPTAPEAVVGNVAPLSVPARRVPRQPPAEGGPTAEVRRLRPRTGLYSAILDDILSLARIRHGGGGIGDGERDRFLFAAATAAANVHPGRMAIAMRELADKLVPGKSEAWVADKVSALTSRVQKHTEGVRLPVGGKAVSPIYSPTVSWFVDFLSVADGEMEHLAKLISDAVRKRRKRGLTPAAQLRAEAHAQTQDLATAAAELYFCRDMSAADAARVLGVGERRVWAVLAIAVADMRSPADD